MALYQQRSPEQLIEAMSKGYGISLQPSEGIRLAEYVREALTNSKGENNETMKRASN
jgi:hypothetical protein